MYDIPTITNELSQTPSGFPGLPEVDVCAALSLLANVTVSPSAMLSVAGMKQSGSHPGVEEPCAFSTVFDDEVVGSDSGSDSGSVGAGVGTAPSSTIINPVIHG